MTRARGAHRRPHPPLLLVFAFLAPTVIVVGAFLAARAS